jgi:hypothetical protein
MVHETFEKYWAANWPENGLTEILNEAFKEVAKKAWHAGALALTTAVHKELGLSE